MKDTYITLETSSPESFFKEKGSKFYGYAFPILNEKDVKASIAALKKLHPTARHFCYAWQLGQEAVRFRANDDGEPTHSAGMPIYGQIQAFDLTHVLVVSVRYFGGTKLGVGGLIQAYKHSAKITLEASVLIEKTIDIHYRLTFPYDKMNALMRILKEMRVDVLQQKLELECAYVVAVRKGEKEDFLNRLKRLYPLKIEALKKEGE